MKVVAVIQARMSSTRLPGKVLLPLAGRPLLGHVVERVRRAARVDEVRVATSTAAVDDAVAEAALAAGALVSRGPERDVLARYALCAREAAADVVVRITADCPLLAPELVDRALERLERTGADYASNTVERRFPRGLDVEALRRAALEQAAAEATAPAEREHVTPFVWSRPERFALASIPAAPEETAPEFRVTVDTPADYACICAVSQLLPPGDFSARGLVAVLRAHAWLAAVNAHVEQKAVWQAEAAP